MIIIVMGVAGSGKTTIGRQLSEVLHWTFADADAYHPAANIRKMSRGVPLTDEDRLPWLRALRKLIERWLSEGQQAVLACSALTSSYRRMLIIDPVRVRLVYLKGTRALIEQRLARRSHHFMPKALLQSQFDTLEEPEEAFTLDAAEPPRRVLQQIRAEFKL
jgi:gluconokinase